MNKPHIIGLAGPAGCGKDTVAQLLATHLGFRQMAFADALRGEVCEAFGIDQSLLTRRDTKELVSDTFALDRCKDMAFIGTVLRRERSTLLTSGDLMEVPRSPRSIMQLWGTDYRRYNSGDHYWTRTLTGRIHTQQQGQQWRHVISDVRFQNEADAIRALGGVIWQVKRPGLQATGTHISDVDGSQFQPDAVINNRHDIRHLQAVVMGEWFMREAGLAAQDIVDMARVHVEYNAASHYL